MEQQEGEDMEQPEGEDMEQANSQKVMEQAEGTGEQPIGDEQAEG